MRTEHHDEFDTPLMPAHTAPAIFHREERKRERRRQRQESLRWLAQTIILIGLVYAVLEVSNW
jgi:hypothetical protein